MGGGGGGEPVHPILCSTGPQPIITLRDPAQNLSDLLRSIITTALVVGLHF